MTDLLSLEDVNVYYGPFHALRGNSLTVGEGEIVSLLGGNASGKSTTMKTILGLVKVKSGTIRLAGKDITSASTNFRVRAGIASVPEARRVFPQMTVDENLMAGAYTRRDKAGVAEIVTLIDWLGRHPEIAHGKLCFACTPDEEIGHGIDLFVLAGCGARYAYTVAGSDLGEVEDETFSADTATIAKIERALETAQTGNE